MRRKNVIRWIVEAVASACLVLALGACETRDRSDAPPALPLPSGAGTIATVSGFAPLRAEDLRAFARQAFGDAAELDAMETAQAATAANDAVTATDGARIAWQSARHSGYAEAVGTRYEKFVWHCHDAATNATYRDHVPCRTSERMVSEAEYWRLSARPRDAVAAPVAPVATVAPVPSRQSCRTINEVTVLEGGRLLAMREHCLPLPSGP